MIDQTPKRVAIVHDWLVTYAGAERVLSALLDLFPDADLFSVVDFLDDDSRRRLHSKLATTTLIQRLPFSKGRYRAYLPIMPYAVEQWDLSAYDLVISSSHAVAKGVITGPDQLHVSYIHSPMRYAWDLQGQYLERVNAGWGVKGIVTRYLLHRLRSWDALSGSRPDVLLANSQYIAKRIEKVYRRTSRVLYPPVDVDAFDVGHEKEDFYFTASRMVPYKRMDLIVEAFTAMPSRRLIVAGAGPEYEAVSKRVTPNIELLGRISDEDLRDLMQRAKAFVFAAEEDFGIVPVEAQAAGTPVIAFGKGGATETVRSSGSAPTGVLFMSQTVEALTSAVEEFEVRRSEFDPQK